MTGLPMLMPARRAPAGAISERSASVTLSMVERNGVAVVDKGRGMQTRAAPRIPCIIATYSSQAWNFRFSHEPFRRLQRRCRRHLLAAAAAARFTARVHARHRREAR